MTYQLTQGGNQVDRSLAKGLAKAAIRMADAEGHVADSKQVSVGNMKGRKRFIEASAKHYKAHGRFLGAAARNEYKQAVITHYGVADLSPSRTLLAVFNDVFWLSGKKHSYNLEHDAHHIVATIEQHALERIAQRKGQKNLVEFLDTLKPIWGWCDAINKAKIKGRFYIAVREGIFCGVREPIPLRYEVEADNQRFGLPDESANPPAENEYFIRIRTFISLDRMKSGYDRLWKKLESAGSFENAPKCPSFRRLTPEQIQVLDIMTTATPQ